jgi:hypothetical protein
MWVGTAQEIFTIRKNLKLEAIQGVMKRKEERKKNKLVTRSR